jgi:maltooligosyltrehalose synthase
MSLLKYLVFGAAVAAGVNYATKKREDGRSFIDDLSEKAPEWMEKAKQYTDQIKTQFGQTTASQNSNSSVQTDNPPY